MHAGCTSRSSPPRRRSRSEIEKLCRVRVAACALRRGRCYQLRAYYLRPRQEGVATSPWSELEVADCASGAPVRSPSGAMASFGVTTNAGAGYYSPAANDSINTMGAFGLGHISSDGSRFNMASPRGNLSRHLERVRQDIERYMPSPLWAGAAVIDFEEWHPVYDANNYGPAGVIHADYRLESRVWVRTRNPNWTAEAVEAAARHEFNAAAQSFMEQTLLLGKAFARMHPGDTTALSCGKWRDETSARGRARWRYCCERSTGWLWRARDALYPGIYLCCSTDHAARNVSFVQAEMQEAHRVMAAVGVGHVLSLHLARLGEPAGSVYESLHT